MKIRHVLLYLLTLLAFSVSVFLAGQSPSLYNLSFAITALVTHLGTERYLHVNERRRSRHCEKDQRLLHEISEMISYDQEITFLREHDHGDAFNTTRTESLYSFAHYGKSPEREILHSRLEFRRKKLLDSVQSYVRANAQYTHPINANAQKLSDHLFATNPEEWQRQRHELNELADRVADAYDILIRTARRIL